MSNKNMKTYPAADVDPILADLYSQVESALEVAKSATIRCEQLEAEHRVTLEKVATMQKTATKAMEIDPMVVDETLQQLVDLSLIKPEGIEKIASDLTADPNNALRLMSRVLTLSAGAHNEGTGIPKSASIKDRSTVDPDGWGLVLEHGA
jgi:hypothetical protein